MVVGSFSWIGFSIRDDAEALIEKLPEAARKLRKDLSKVVFDRVESLKPAGELRPQASSFRSLEEMPAVGLPALLAGMIGTLIAARGLLPIHHRPPALQIIGTPVFMFQVVGMLPDIVE